MSLASKARSCGTPMPEAAGVAAKSEVEVLEPASRASATARTGAESLEAGEPRLAVGVDFAGVELLAFLRVAHDLVGVGQFGEFLARLRIVLVAIRVQCLARRRYAFLMSASLAERPTPRTS